MSLLLVVPRVSIRHPDFGLILPVHCTGGLARGAGKPPIAAGAARTSAVMTTTTPNLPGETRPLGLLRTQPFPLLLQLLPILTLPLLLPPLPLVKDHPPRSRLGKGCPRRHLSHDLRLRRRRVRRRQRPHHLREHPLRHRPGPVESQRAPVAPVDRRR